MPSTLPDPRYTQLRTWYEQLTARIAATDKDVDRSVYEHERQLHRERLTELIADRELITAYLDALERDQPLPGLWPPEFKTTDLLAAPPPRFLFKSGRCDFYHHIPLPPNYIPRPELLVEVRERLLAGMGGLALTSAIQVKQADVLHGMGGIGKSVLARALCEDPDVQAAFPDGILWATLGQTPDLTARLREWIETLGGIVGQTAPTLDQLRNALAEALRDKACLLIVDDAWRKAHLEPFCAGGSHCRLLITTRDAALAEGLDAGVYPVPVMAPNQAVALLEEWAQGGLAEVEAEVKGKIAKRLGYLPLAVRLAGAQLRAKYPVEWLTSFDARKLKTRRVEAAHDSLEATFGLSLDALAPANRRLYVALAIFKEDETIPVVAIARLWGALDGCNAAETSELLDNLADRALLARILTDGDVVAVHDLLRDFIAAELGEEGRTAAHRALLDAYRRTRLGDGWHTAPDDGYLYDHLAYHLDAIAEHDATAREELTGLFVDQSWLHARVAQSGYLYDGYLADLDFAWRRDRTAADCQIDADQEPSALAACARCALIRTSINSLTANRDPALLARAVETGLWTAERALSLGRLIPSPVTRANLFLALLQIQTLTSDQRQVAARQGFAAAQGISREAWRAEAMTALAPYLAGELLSEGLAAAQTLWNQEYRARVLTALGPQLTGETRGWVLQRALAAAQAIDANVPRARALIAVAPQFTNEVRHQVLQDALTATQAVRDDHLRQEVLAVVTPQLEDEVGKTAAQPKLSVQSIIDRRSHAEILAAIAPRLGEMWHRTALKVLMVATQANGYVGPLVPKFTQQELQKVLETLLSAAQTIRDERTRVWALIELAPQLIGEVREIALQDALTLAYAIGIDRFRAEALAALVPHLACEKRRQVQKDVVIATQAINDQYIRAATLATVVSQLTVEMRELLLRAELATIRGSNVDWSRIAALIILAPQLTGELAQEGLAIAETIGDEWHRASVLTALAPQLAGEIREPALQAALASALAISEAKGRVKALVALASQTSGEVHEQSLQEALAAVHLVGGVVARAEALTAIASQLSQQPSDNLETMLQTELVYARSIPDEEDRQSVLTRLAPQLTGELVKDGLTAAEAINNEQYRMRVLAALVPQLRGDLLGEGLTIAQKINDEYYRGRTLVAFLPYAADPAACRRSIRHATVKYLRNNLADRTREDVLQFIADDKLFAPPILSPATLAAIAGHIIEICQEWEWL